MVYVLGNVHVNVLGNVHGNVLVMFLVGRG